MAFGRSDSNHHSAGAFLPVMRQFCFKRVHTIDRTFAMNVSQIYDGDGEPVEMKIELALEGNAR